MYWFYKDVYVFDLFCFFQSSVIRIQKCIKLKFYENLKFKSCLVESENSLYFLRETRKTKKKYRNKTGVLFT